MICYSDHPEPQKHVIPSNQHCATAGLWNNQNPACLTQAWCFKSGRKLIRTNLCNIHIKWNCLVWLIWDLGGFFKFGKTNWSKESMKDPIFTPQLNVFWTQKPCLDTQASFERTSLLPQNWETVIQFLTRITRNWEDCGEDSIGKAACLCDCFC